LPEKAGLVTGALGPTVGRIVYRR